MVSSRTTKIIVDILMTVFLILSFIRWEGDPTFHLIVGTACALFFAMHVCIHRKWIKAVTKLFWAGKINKMIKGKYVIDVLLLAVWAIAIVTGFLAIGPYIAGIERSVFGRLHGVFVRLGLLLIVVHIVQHRSQIVSYVKVKTKKIK